MEKIVNQIGFAVFKFSVAMVGFGFWFLILGIWSQVAGLVVGVVVASFLLIVMNIKRNNVCDNADTQLAAKRADDLKNLKRITNSNERQLSQNPIKSNLFPISGQNKTKNIKP